jgi:hypothetical protein
MTLDDRARKLCDKLFGKRERDDPWAAHERYHMVRDALAAAEEETEAAATKRERAACANLCEEMVGRDGAGIAESRGLYAAAVAIRARGKS